MTVADLVAKLGLDWKQDDFEKANGALEKLAKGAKVLAEAYGAKKIFEGLEKIAKSAMESAHEVTKMSERFGVSAEKLQELGAAAGDLGMEGVGQAMKFLSRNAYEAATKGGDVANVFRKLGVGSLYDTNGQLKTADVLMGEVADGMSKIQDPTARAALATKLFGREGAQMVNMLSKGKKGMEELAKERMRYNSTFSAAQLEKAEKMRKSEHGMDAAFTGLRNTIADRLFPIFERFYRIVDVLVERFVKWIDKSSIVEIGVWALIGVMGALAIATIIALGPWLLLAAGIAAAILVLDDIVTSFRGGKSLLTEFGQALEDAYDKFMKFGSSNVFVNTLIDSVKLLLHVLNTAKNTLFALVLAAQGDFSGFKTVVEQMKTDFAPQIADAMKIGSAVQGAGQTAFATASSGIAAASNWATMQMAPVTVNQTINASPGMDESKLADKAADGASDVLHQHALEQAHAKLVPALP